MTAPHKQHYGLLSWLHSEGRLEGAVFITGRSAAKKNDTINGVYLLRKTMFHGARSYEKADGKSKRFIFYSATKNSWKISDELNDGKSGFAHAAVKDRGTLPPTTRASGNLEWKVFDGKEEGYNKDDRVLCLDIDEVLEECKSQGGFAPHPPGTVPPPTSLKRCFHHADPAVSEEVSVAKRRAAAEKGASQEAGPRSAKAKGSARSSAGRIRDRLKDKLRLESEMGSLQVVTAVQGSAKFAKVGLMSLPASPPVALGGAAASSATSAGAGASPAAAGSGAAAEAAVVAGAAVPAKRGLICGKMLARAGLRCECHFAYLSDCPTRGATPPAVPQEQVSPPSATATAESRSPARSPAASAAVALPASVATKASEPSATATAQVRSPARSAAASTASAPPAAIARKEIAMQPSAGAISQAAPQPLAPTAAPAAMPPRKIVTGKEQAAAAAAAARIAVAPGLPPRRVSASSAAAPPGSQRARRPATPAGAAAQPTIVVLDIDVDECSLVVPSGLPTRAGSLAASATTPATKAKQRQTRKASPSKNSGSGSSPILIVV